MYSKGWLRIVEASLAALIVLGVLFAVYTKNAVSNEPDLSENARAILEEISNNNTLRNDVLRSDTARVNLIVAREVTDPSLEFEMRVCDLNDVCGKSTYTPGNVYTAERVISATVEQSTFAPKKMRLFIWRKLT